LEFALHNSNCRDGAPKPLLQLQQLKRQVRNQRCEDRDNAITRAGGNAVKKRGRFLQIR
jgi:hypothetical protein